MHSIWCSESGVLRPYGGGVHFFFAAEIQPKSNYRYATPGPEHPCSLSISISWAFTTTRPHGSISCLPALAHAPHSQHREVGCPLLFLTLLHRVRIGPPADDAHATVIFPVSGPSANHRHRLSIIAHLWRRRTMPRCQGLRALQTSLSCGIRPLICISNGLARTSANQTLGVLHSKPWLCVRPAQKRNRFLRR